MAESEAAAAEMAVIAAVSAADEAPVRKSPAIESSSEPDDEISSPASAAASNHKRKLEPLEDDDEENPTKKQELSAPQDVAETLESSAAVESNGAKKESDAVKTSEGIDGSGGDATEAPEEAPANAMQDETVADEAQADAMKLPLDGETGVSAADASTEVQKLEVKLVENGQHPSSENTDHASVENPQKLTALFSNQGNPPPTGLQPSMSSRKVEIPNNKVGVLIGKSGDTIKFLQFNSGAKIQITRDAEADPNSSTRPVELVGTLESVEKAEQLIKDVLTEADAGGSPALVARGFATGQSGTEHIEIRVPNEKVGMIIGKGGQTIKDLQTRSGARVQLIPQHLPPGDLSMERIVRVTGNKKQIESASEMIKEVMNQIPKRSSISGGYNQQSIRPRGPTTVSHWVPNAAAPMQPTVGYYGYQQRGMSYPPQATQYPPQTYTGYSQQPPPRSNPSTGWDQRSTVPTQAPPQTAGYDYYGQGGPSANIQSSNPVSTPAPGSTPAPVNYSYEQSQASGYGHPTTYTQSAPAQQNYGQEYYNEPKYDSQAPGQPMYGQQPLSSQPGQSGYPQQLAYSKSVPQSYGQPRVAQPGDPMYQGPALPSYGSSRPTQQTYYSSNAPTQPASVYNHPYGPPSGAGEGYMQPSSGGYSQQGSQAPVYGQGGQAAPAYTQPGAQSGSYGQYSSSQMSYGDQQVAVNANYGYQGGSADAGYGGNNSVSSGGGYGAPQPTSGQPGYVQQQPTPNPSGYYDQQPMPQQLSYGGAPGSAPAGYVKSLSPQPGYGGQYEASQMYGHH